ncbi:MAG: hypothetical protein IMY72_11905 [Bacteroidetes bacterium]|nr:hypothetical protein [Bacteroidota bacterium]
MMTIKEKRVEVHKLLYRLGALQNKADVLASYGVKSTTELSNEEIDHLIYRLKLGLFNRRESPTDLRRWRSNALVYLNKIGIYATNNDWSDVNSFMLDNRICGKLLFELSVEELKALCKKLRIIANKKATTDRKLLLNINLN